MKELVKIQKELKAPKNQFNSFGKYNYRSCEDILEAVKPLLGESLLLLSDSIESHLDRVYVKATATFINGEDRVEVSALAREVENKKGMDDSQITGTSSSYARKYALNGLFLIDDTKDADTTKHELPELKPEDKKNWDKVKTALDGNYTLEQIETKWFINEENKKKL